MRQLLRLTGFLAALATAACGGAPLIEDTTLPQDDPTIGQGSQTPTEPREPRSADRPNYVLPQDDPNAGQSQQTPTETREPSSPDREPYDLPQDQEVTDGEGDDE